MHKRPLVIIGGGGHTRVLLGILHALAWPVEGIVTSDPLLIDQEILGTRILGLEGEFALDPARVVLANGVGNRPSRQGPGTHDRADLYRRYGERGFVFPALVSPQAMIAMGVTMGDGAQVMAGAVVQPGAQLGENCIVNTSATVDHDSVIERHAHVGPGAVLCGQVTVGEGAHVGAGAVIIQGMSIGRNAVVGAGSVVYRPVPVGVVLMAAPSVKLKEMD